MASVEEQVIFRCSTLERDLDIMYCRSLRNFEPRGEVVMSCSMIELKRTTSKKEALTIRKKDCIALLIIILLIILFLLSPELRFMHNEDPGWLWWL